MMIFIVPGLTMRLISEEKRLGTFELLVTCPLRDWSILLGKYFAALSAGAVILFLSAAYPLTVQLISGGAAENAVILSSYLGMFLVLAAYVAFGTFASSTTDNQMLAAILTFILLLSIYILAFINIGETIKVFGTVTLRQVFDALSPVTHAENFSKGVFSLVNISYFIFFISFFLIVAAKILEARRWRV
jgi:ABC-2 type transport system permease protein